MKIPRLDTVFSAVFSKYLAASVVALAIDMGAFIQLLAMGADTTLAAAASYSIGIVVHWILSSRAVFQKRVAQRGGGRTIQKVQFVLSALTGLALTTAVVEIGSQFLVHPYVSKILAVALSFFVVWYVRNRFIFKDSEQLISREENCHKY